MPDGGEGEWKYNFSAAAEDVRISYYSRDEEKCATAKHAKRHAEMVFVLPLLLRTLGSQRHPEGSTVKKQRKAKTLAPREAVR
jgi:hypothetical protein